jgi:hypothetical protein
MKVRKVAAGLSHRSIDLKPLIPSKIGSEFDSGKNSQDY